MFGSCSNSYFFIWMRQKWKNTTIAAHRCHSISCKHVLWHYMLYSMQLGMMHFHIWADKTSSSTVCHTFISLVLFPCCSLRANKHTHNFRDEKYSISFTNRNAVKRKTLQPLNHFTGIHNSVGSLDKTTKYWDTFPSHPFAAFFYFLLLILVYLTQRKRLHFSLIMSMGNRKEKRKKIINEFMKRRTRRKLEILLLFIKNLGAQYA